MRRTLLFLAISSLAACMSPMPAANPNMAWVDFAMPSPGGKVLMAESLDKKTLDDGRFFQVTPGSHELKVRFDFEVSSGGFGMDLDAPNRLCYLTVHYDHFEAGQRYLLEARSLGFTPSARLYNAKRELIAEGSETFCVQ
ncbi:hypothetical protein [Pseudomonas sp. 6D_7.1_Bac1]|jgi:hypothetical protein|uniref:PA0061/PA0062 family lipoprotein n=1 Tax=Pseudomonas sp. 6D_7.1_Bac1 TaxID=2971615 RepID=UPI0021C8DF86|nr:hypothetical protein [Pseudomonas sp. 6D_7.1_Bac1]MCU1748212.1 hypothetical protein [Pseudomonas sp. 6D_7.1_Bac1]